MHSSDGAEWIGLNNGVPMPRIGLGMACIEPGKELDAVIPAAIEAGYRLFDNAPLYGNEAEVGAALRAVDTPREELFLSSKLPNAKHKYEDALKAFGESLKRLGTDYLDLYLVHWPVPAQGLYLEAWKALEKLYNEGLVRAIGVSNFLEHHLEKLLASCEVRPVINQVECNPYLGMAGLRQYCLTQGIVPESWFPLGGPAVPLKGASPDKVLLEDPVLAELGSKYQKTVAQIVLRWHVQSNIIPVPKTSKPSRLLENIDIFGCCISDEDMGRLDALDYGRRCGPHPDECNDLF
ncbi:MAG: aldo/keto reductase [Armatimonadetes bacterium]|nr:aldo/keto reductase [Armatimonadota bacterium]